MAGRCLGAGHDVLATGRTMSLNATTPSSLIAKLAETPAEIDAAQALRYRVFFEERDAKATPRQAALRRDIDPFDEVADHLIVVDSSIADASRRVVGTYRLLRHGAAARADGIYTAGEYDVTRLLNRGLRLLELGRSCVAKSHRTRHTINLLWHAIATYIDDHRIDLLFGCASFPGTDPLTLRLPLSYLYHYHLAPSRMRPRAVEARFVEMNRLAKSEISTREALFAMPPLIKGYIRLGAHIGDGAVIDPDFGTVDVCIVLSREQIDARYGRHYRGARKAL